MIIQKRKTRKRLRISWVAFGVVLRVEGASWAEKLWKMEGAQSPNKEGLKRVKEPRGARVKNKRELNGERSQSPALEASFINRKAFA